MNNQSVLNINITGFFNELLKISYPHELSEDINGNLFDKIINLTYNSFNETVYIETTKHLYLMQYEKGVMLRITEFDKPEGSATNGLWNRIR